MKLHINYILLWVKTYVITIEIILINIPIEDVIFIIFCSCNLILYFVLTVLLHIKSARQF